MQIVGYPMFFGVAMNVNPRFCGCPPQLPCNGDTALTTITHSSIRIRYEVVVDTLYLSQFANHSIVVEESLERPAVVGYEHRRAVFLVLVPLPRVSRPIRIHERALHGDRRCSRLEGRAFRVRGLIIASGYRMVDQSMLLALNDVREACGLEWTNLKYSRTRTAFF